MLYQDGVYRHGNRGLKASSANDDYVNYITVSSKLGLGRSHADLGATTFEDGHCASTCPPEWISKGLILAVTSGLYCVK